MRTGQDGQNALITGATGFLGREVSRAMLSAGWRVRGVARPGAPPLEPGVEPWSAEDVLDARALRRAAEGIDVVVHLAGRAHIDDPAAATDLAEFRRVNVEGARIALEAAAGAGVRTFVLASSLAASTTVDDGPTRSQSGFDDPYGRSKLEAERLVRALAAERGIAAPILRPAMCYGPGMKGNPLRLFRAVDAGWPLPFGAVQNLRSVLFSGNLAAAVLAVATSRTAAAEPFAVADAEPLSTPDLIRRIAAALGRRAHLVHVPPSLLRIAALAGDAVPAGLRFPLRSRVIERLLESLVVETGPLARETGYAPRYSTSEGLWRTAAWYRAQGSVRAPRARIRA